MGLKIKDFNMEVHWKIQFSGMGFTKKPIIGGNSLKQGDLDSFQS